MNRADIFLDKYKELETLLISKRGLPDDGKAISTYSRQFRNSSIKAELDYCRDVRNLLAHKPKIDNHFAVEPSDGMIELLNTAIQEIKSPLRARSKAISIENVFTRSLGDSVLEAMRTMSHKGYTHIPILEKGTVIGVFSENTIFTRLANEALIGVDENLKFSDFETYLPIDKHISESFRFAAFNSLLSSIETMFSEAVKKMDRIGMVFLTENGKPSEKLLGILTSWDLVGIS